VDVDQRVSEARRLLTEGRAQAAAGQTDAALAGLHESAELFSAAGERTGELDALEAAAIACAMGDRGTAAVDLLTKITALLSDGTREERRGMAIGNLGLALAGLGRHDEALARFTDARVILEAAGNRPAVARQFGNAGSACRDLERWDDAVENYVEALDIFRSLGLDEDVADQCTNIAYALVMKGEPIDALGWFQKAATEYAAGGFEEKRRLTVQNLERLQSALGIVLP
jgi:tetratricopeptide (TPR) repeat protein